MNRAIDLASRRILVVGNSETGREVSHAIGPLGDVSVCESAIGALRSIAEQPVDCIVCSMTLSDMHATRLLDELKRREVRVPVLVITSSAELSDAVAVMHAGAHHVVEGPPYAPALRNRVACALG